MTKIVRKYSANADEVFSKVKETCQRLGLRIAAEDAITRSLQVSTGLSALSWGETMSLIVSQQRDGSTITLSSSAKVWFNLTAASRADRKAQVLLEELDRVI